MKVLVEGAELAHAAQHVSRVLDKLDPDHTHITLTAEHDTVTLTANSRSQWARTRLDADVLEPGTVIVSGFWFTALAGQNGLGETVIETRTDARGEWLHTVNGRTRARMRLMPGAAENEWPDMQGMELALPDGTLPRLINAVTHCASRNQSRPLLTGVHIHGDGDHVVFEATDRYRAARAQVDAPGFTGSVVVPAEWLKRVGRDATSLHIGSHLVMASNRVDEDMTVVLDGQYPDIARIIPNTEDEYPLVVHAGRDELLAAVKYLRALDMDNRDTLPVDMTVTNGEVVCTQAASADSVGQVTLDGTSVDGAMDGMLRLNAQFLADITASWPHGTVDLRVRDALKPVLFTQGDNDNDEDDGARLQWRQVLVPIRQ